MIDLSIIIVSYNARNDLLRCLSSLKTHPPALRHEVIVVDNASTDGSAEAAEGVENVIVARSSSNVGFAAGCNMGIQASTGGFLLLLNSDTIVPPGAIDALAARLIREPNVAAVGPRIIDGNGIAELSFGKMLTPMIEWRRRRFINQINKNNPVALNALEELTTKEQYPDWVTGACLLVRRFDAYQAGLLDERFFLYTEDVDFCASLRAHGKRILFFPNVEIVHLRGKSGLSSPSATSAAYRRSHLAFYRKHHSLWAVPIYFFHWFQRIMK